MKDIVPQHIVFVHTDLTWGGHSGKACVHPGNLEVAPPSGSARWLVLSSGFPRRGLRRPGIRITRRPLAACLLQLRPPGREESEWGVARDKRKVGFITERQQGKGVLQTV